MPGSAACRCSVVTTDNGHSDGRNREPEDALGHDGQTHLTLETFGYQFSNQSLLAMFITAPPTNNPLCVLPSYHTKTRARAAISIFSRKGSQ
jgi:hypothetical protein